MASWFEDATKTLADEKMGRCTALRRVAGTVAGVALASALPGAALAKVNKHCLAGGGNYSIGFVNCKNNPNPNCYCWEKLGGTPVCGCNFFCSQAFAFICSNSLQCPKGIICAVNNTCNCGSSQGICTFKCKGIHKNCKLGTGYGLTATGRVV